MAEPASLRVQERNLEARAAKQQRAAAARKKAIIAAGGQVAETNRGPGTLSGLAYDLLGKGVSGIHSLTGASPRNARDLGRRAVEDVQGLTESLFGLGETERSLQNVTRGQADRQDYINAGLAVVPSFLAPPAKAAGRFVAKQVGKRAPAVAKGAKAVTNYATDIARGPASLVDEVPIDAASLKVARRPKARRLPAPAPKAEVPTPRFAALPAAAERPALAAPGPGLPPHAAKPRGGQWWADKEISGSNFSPENAAREVIPPGVLFSSDARDRALRDWWSKAVPKYLKTDFAGPTDPLRDLAERGLLHIPDTTPEGWSKMAGESFTEDPLQSVLFNRNPRGGMPGAGDDLRGEVMSAMPWLARVPATENLYGVSRNSLSGLEFGHVADELRNAMAAEAHGIPADLAVRPEMLQRMSFPQAVERVGRINQMRAAQQAEAALSSFNNPAVHTFKEYGENNPMGLRWAELKAPGEESGLFNIIPAEEQGKQFHFVENPATGERVPVGGTREAALEQARQMFARDPLQEALKYEGDTMGHCVGGYCPRVMSGESRIFSLRDAKGEPHVTIETRPGDQSEIYKQAIADLRDTDYWDVWLENQRNRANNPGNTGDLIGHMNAFRVSQGLEPLGKNLPEDIIQIKGKANRAPKEDYLPFVQDFVKSGRWGDIGDLGNTGLERLPDQRFITQGQLEEGVSKFYEQGGRQSPYYRQPENWDEETWDQLKPYFEGFRRGGFVIKPNKQFSVKGCACEHRQ